MTDWLHKGEHLDGYNVREDGMLVIFSPRWLEKIEYEILFAYFFLL